MGTPSVSTAPWWQSRQLRLALSLVLMIVGVLTFLNGRGGKASASGEIFLASADSAGGDTFTPSVAAPPLPQQATTATTSPAPSSGGLVRANGGSPGLYGGARDVASCDAQKLTSYLEANPDHARPWAEASGIKVADIKAYVDTLTPVLTRIDTRVTDFGFAAGKAVPRQMIVQAGTAVFVDRTAFPRVRCASGNPLGEPQPVSRAPRYRGAPWTGFKPSTVVVITPAPTVILVLVDVRSGLIFVRIPGSVVIIDIDRPAEGETLAIVEPGGNATITGTNWPPGTPVTMTFDNPPVNLGAATADGGGNFTATVTVPLEATLGVHKVAIDGGGFAAAQRVFVVPKGVPRARVVLG
jgi:hypothetical protein